MNTLLVIEVNECRVKTIIAFLDRYGLKPVTEKEAIGGKNDIVIVNEKSDELIYSTQKFEYNFRIKRKLTTKDTTLKDIDWQDKLLTNLKNFRLIT